MGNGLGLDIDGMETVSVALLRLANEFPGLGTGQTVRFATLSPTSGMGLFPNAGAALREHKEDVLGHVRQLCLYPFTVVYRAAPESEAQRLRIKEFLDTFGKWLERQPVLIDGAPRQLGQYPALGGSGSRKIRDIRRTTPAYFSEAYNDGIEDWAIAAQLSYENEYYK